MTSSHHQIDYVELPARDIAATQAFYGHVFGWSFREWAPTYVSFSGAGMEGGFDAGTPVATGGVLIVLFSEDLEKTLAAVETAGGSITRPIFSFPGGRRFHFTDPNGNVLAVWGADPDQPGN